MAATCQITPDEKPADKWTVVEMTVTGKGAIEIAKKLNRTTVAVRRAALGMGAPRLGPGGGGDSGNRALFFNFGEPFTPDSLRYLKEALGLSASQFAKEVGLPTKRIEKNLRGDRVSSEVARKVAHWRDTQVVPRLLASSTRRGGAMRHNFGARRVLKTFFPNIVERYRLLVRALGKMRQFLKHEPSAPSTRLKQWICDQAFLETSGYIPGPKLMSRFVWWAPELMPNLAVQLERIAGAGHHLLAQELIASYWKISHQVVNAVVYFQVDPIPPNEMYWLIQDRPQNGTNKQLVAQRAPVTKRGPRKPEHQKEYFLVGKEIESQITEFETLFNALASVSETVLRNLRALERHLSNLGFNKNQIDVARTARQRNALQAAREYVSRRRNIGRRAVTDYHLQYKAFLSRNNTPSNLQ